MLNEITVSIAERVKRWSAMMHTPRISPNATRAQSGSAIPSNTPSPMPVREACPMASEKNAMRLLTTRVPMRAKSGETIKTASKAVRMNANCVHSNGSKEIRWCQAFMSGRGW